MKSKLLSLLTITILLTSCGTVKTIKLMKSGSVNKEEFKVKVPFEYRMGLIVLKVNISGTDYDFVLDTGAPNIISVDLAKKLGINSSVKQDVGDSQGSSSDLGFAKVDNIAIGGIEFLNTGAVIADLKESKEVGCLKIDGFIGSNLMRKAIWKFDYKNQIITITNSKEALNITKPTYKIPFYTELTGTPIVDIKLDNTIVKNVCIDLGSNGDIDISLSKDKKLNDLIKNTPSDSKAVSFGSSSSGLYGVGSADSIYHIAVSNISFGDIVIDKSVVDIKHNSSSTIGTRFFKKYDVIIDWFNKEMLLIKNKEYNNKSLSTYGFSYNNRDGKLFINQIFIHSDAHYKGLKVGDRVIEIDDVNYETILPEQWCDIVEHGLIKSNKSISIKVERDNRELSFTLEETVLIAD